MDAESAHDWTARLLLRAQSLSAGRALLRGCRGSVPARSVAAFGLTFPNVLGVAAGFDKNVTVTSGLAELGFGHIEVGTLTPRAQAGNPRPRVFRLPSDRALINRMGFPNCGVEAALPRLQKLSQGERRFVLGVSLGKQKETPLPEAAGDYLTVMRAVYPYADYLAVNISSPNTPELRALQGEQYLGELLSALVGEARRLAELHRVTPRPVLLKVAPDLSSEELEQVVAAAVREGASGLIATNTTLNRSGLTHPCRSEVGGLSGRPLTERSTEVIAAARRLAGDRLPIIGVGGVFTADDVRRKLDAGAVLVQAYTGMIYEGPGMAGKVLRDLGRGG